MKCARAVSRLLLALSLLFVNSSLLAQRRPRSRAVLIPPTGNFQNPGARSLGLGGAFIALADDASAAELNPAGLTQLRRPEVSVEYRRLEAAFPVTYRDAEPVSALECADSPASGASCGNTFRSELDSLSYASIVVPFGRKWTTALYRHELDRGKVFLIRPAFNTEEFGQLPGAFEGLDRRITRTGMAFSFAFSSELSMGVSVNLSSMKQSFHVVEYAPVEEDLLLLYDLQDSTIQQQRFGATGGILWRPIREISFGASYSSSVRFDETGIFSLCADFEPQAGFPLCGFEEGAPAFDNRYFRFGFSSSFTLPSRIGLSAAFRPTSWLALIGEADRVAYSENDSEREQTNEEGEVIGFHRFSVKDVWELHGGVELALALSNRALLGLRAGYWRDPDHSFRYQGCRPRPGLVCDPIQAFRQTNPPAGALDHYAGGIGVAWAWGQLDVGYDWVARNRVGTLAASLVIRAK